VRGLVMLTEARESAPPRHRNWISGMQEEAFALATEEERRLAIQMINTTK